MTMATKRVELQENKHKIKNSGTIYNIGLGGKLLLCFFF